MRSAGHRIIGAVNWWRVRFGGGPNPTVVARRRDLERFSRLFPVVRGTRIEEVDAGGVPGEWVLAPGSSRRTAVLYLHGGSYSGGSPRTHRALASRISRASGAALVVIDYRLAPEHRFPAALDDVATAYRWILGAGVDPARVAVAGDSAGGGLAVSLLVSLRDAGEPLPAAAVLLSPWTDLAGTGDSIRSKAAADPWLDPDKLVPAARAYVGDEPLDNPLASPLYADLGGLPPLLVQVGSEEILLDDARRLVGRARAAGTRAVLDEAPGQIHVFQAFAPYSGPARAAIGRIGRFIREHAAG
jgi:acetyl esterase/lipase